MAVAVGQDGGGDVRDVTEVDHRLVAVERPGQTEDALLEGGLEPHGQHEVGRLQDCELEAR